LLPRAGIERKQEASMFIASISDRGATPALVKMLGYNEARLKVSAENVANFGTPGYRAQHLDVKGFQRALRQALDERGSDPHKAFVVEQGGEVRQDEQGYLQVTPSETPVQNVLFHDGTNMSLEQEMAELARTGMSHELYTSLLRGRFEGMRKAIRGTM